MTGRQFGVDRDGTFTDVVTRRPDGRLLPHTLLSDRSARLPADLCAALGVQTEGFGAGDGLPGAPVVRTHVTDSRLTDPEVLERRLPVRRIRFLEPMTLSTPSQHRRTLPYGMAGGEPGALGANRVEHADGTVTALGGSDCADVAPGDVLVIETPGGGGYGSPSPDPHQAGEEIDDLRAF